MKYIGIDYGTKRVGVAVSDDEGVLAFPRVVLPNDAELVNKLAEMIAGEHIEEIVIGESFNYKNVPNPLHAKALSFSERLRNKTNLFPRFHIEALTSREAMHIQGDNAMNDASAAAIMLQSYLDRKNKRPSIDTGEA